MTFAREDPPDGGPLAGLPPAWPRSTRGPDLVVVLAVDMPRVTAGTVARLPGGGRGRRRRLLVDAAAGASSPASCAGRARRRAPGARRTALPMRRLMGAGATVDVAAVGHEADDVDTWADLARLRATDRSHATSRSDLKTRRRFREIGPVNLHDWIDELCDVLDIETEVDEALVLDLAKVAADNVVRRPRRSRRTCSGTPPAPADADVEEIERLAARAQALAEGWDRPSGAPDPDDVDDEVPDDSAVDHTGDEYE